MSFITKRYMAPLSFLVAGIIIWETAVRIFAIPAWLLPSPVQVLITFREMLPLLIRHSQSTVLAALAGLLAAVLVALVLAVLMDVSPLIKQGIYPLIVVSQTIPIISIAPLFIIWFGYGILPKVIVVALVCFFPVVVSIIEGMEAAGPDMVNLLRVMGASRWQIIKLVKFPAALPSFFAGLKIAGTYAVMGAVIGEWLGAKSGLGVFMTRASYAYQMSRVLAAIAVISIVSLAIFVLIEILARIFMPWLYKRKGEMINMFKKGVAPVIILLLLVTTVGCSTAKNTTGTGSSKTGSPKPRPVTVMLDWVPNTNHTGLYVALEKGWYEEEGLDVEIVQPPQGGTTQLVATGEAQFGVGYQEDITQARANDVPIVSIAAVIQHNTSGFASKKSEGITRPREMEGKTYGGWGSPTEEAVLKAVIENDGGDFSKINIINIGTSDFFTAIEREIDFAWIYYGWTGIEAELRGIELNYLELRKLHEALDYYTPVLFTSEKIISSEPELVKKFMSATARGYKFAIDNPEEAARILLKHAPELDEKLVVASQKYLSPRYRDDAKRWGEQKAEVWERYARWMYENKLLPKMIEPETAFTNEFLPE